MNISYFYFVLSYLILSGGRAAIIILHYITNHTKVPKQSNSILANLVKFGLVTFALSDGFLPANSYLSNPPIPGPTKQSVDLKMHQKKISIILYQQKFAKTLRNQFLFDLHQYTHQSEHSSHWIIRSSGLYGISHLQNLAHVFQKR